MKKKLVQIIEIWQEVEEGGQIYDFRNNRNMKLVAKIANGVPLILDDKFVMEKRYAK